MEEKDVMDALQLFFPKEKEPQEEAPFVYEHVEWFLGYPFVIIMRLSDCFRNGYIGIPQGHKLYGMDTLDPKTLRLFNQEGIYQPLREFSYSKPTILTLDHLPFPIAGPKMWWYGFSSFNRCRDVQLCNYYRKLYTTLEATEMEKIEEDACLYTLEFFKEECRRAIVSFTKINKTVTEK